MMGADGSGEQSPLYLRALDPSPSNHSDACVKTSQETEILFRSLKNPHVTRNPRGGKTQIRMARVLEPLGYDASDPILRSSLSPDLCAGEVDGEHQGIMERVARALGPVLEGLV